MGYLINRAKGLPSKTPHQGAIVLAFFFNAKSSNLMAKTILGLFQSLLHQLIIQDPPVPEDIMKTFIGRNNTQSGWRWKENEIVLTFLRGLTQRKTRPISIFIDALDECGTDGTTREVMRIVDLLEEATLSALRDGRSFNVCVTARHFPNIQFKHRYKVTMEDNNKHDINTFIEKWLPSAIALSCDAQGREALKAEIAKRAGGIFLWVKLTIDKVRDLAARGECVVTIREAIQSVDPSLIELYRRLVCSAHNEEDRKNMLQILVWILFSEQSLDLREMRHVMALAGSTTSSSSCDGMAQEWLSNIEHLPLNRQLVDLIRTRTKGLVDVVPLSQPSESTESQPPLRPSTETVAKLCRHKESSSPDCIACFHELEQIGARDASLSKPSSARLESHETTGSLSTPIKNSMPSVQGSSNSITTLRHSNQLNTSEDTRNDQYNDPKKPYQVKLIHESVRTFFLNEGLGLLDKTYRDQPFTTSQQKLYDDRLKNMKLHETYLRSKNNHRLIGDVMSNNEEKGPSVSSGSGNMLPFGEDEAPTIQSLLSKPHASTSMVSVGDACLE